MPHVPDILCIGSALWDTIGHAPVQLHKGSDAPGRITRQPGGVAMNIAMTLAQIGLRPSLLTAIGHDSEGDALIAAAQALHIGTAHIYRSATLPTDQYMAVEGTNGLIAAIADAHSLEIAGDKILRPLANGLLGDMTAPYGGLIALDGNLTPALLAHIATSPLFERADLRVVSASPGKATRLLPFLPNGRAVLYLNREEAGLLCETVFPNSEAAATALIARGARRALVTDGADAVSDASPEGIETQTPPKVTATRVTGAGDTFMAAHIAAEASGSPRAEALARALTVAAHYVTGGDPT